MSILFQDTQYYSQNDYKQGIEILEVQYNLHKMNEQWIEEEDICEEEKQDQTVSIHIMCNQHWMERESCSKSHQLIQILQ